MPIEPSDLTTDLAYVYTTEDRIERLLGSLASLEWSDHDDNGVTDPKVMSDSIYQGTAEIELYCRGLYLPEDMVNNTWVVSVCTQLSALRLCHNRGNSPPEGLVAECERLRRLLESVRTGDMTIPGLAMRADMRPAMVNRVIDRRFKRRTVRVDRQTSTDSPTMLRQDRVNDGPWYAR